MRASWTPSWRQLFLDFPDRFMVGTDTLHRPSAGTTWSSTPAYSRKWLADLPADVADNIAFRNAERLAAWALGQ